MTATNTPICTPEVQADAFEARVRNLPLELALGHDADNEWKLNSILCTWPYLTGEMPFHWNHHIAAVRPDALCVPTGGVPVRTCSGGGPNECSTVIVGEGWIATIARRMDTSLWISVSAVSEEIGAAVFAEAKSWTAE